MKRWSYSLLMAGLMALAWCGAAVIPAGAQLGPNPQINAKGVVVWQGYDGAHYQIYRWDPKTQTAVDISQSSLNDYGYSEPQINAKGQVVWQSNWSSVWLYNPKTGQASQIVP